MHILLEGRQVDLTSRLVQCDDGRTLTLTELEARLLGFLVQRKGATVQREELLSQVWGYRADVVTRCVDSAVRRLRTKLEENPAEPKHILKVHGHGYRLDPVGAPQPMAPPAATDVTSAGLRMFGRAAVLERIGRAMDAGYRQIFIRGIPGIGRTALLDEVALRYGGRFAGGAWRVVPDDDRPKLIVLDGPTALPDDPTATLVIAGSGPGQGFEITVGTLDVAEAVSLLRHRSGLTDVAAVVDRLGGHPGALVEAARALAVHDPASVAREGLRLLPKTRDALAAALCDLDGREVLQALAVFPDRFSLTDAEGVAGAALPGTLALAGWVTADGGAYRLPKVVREMLEPPLDARHRFCVRVLARSEAAGDDLDFWPDIDAALDDAFARADLAYAITLVGAVGPQAQRADRWDWLEAWYRRLGPEHVDVAAVAACRWLRQCGELDRQKTRLDLSRARFERAHQIAVAAGDAPEIAMTTGCLAILAHTDYRRDEAEVLYRRAADLCLAAGLDHYHRIFLGNLGRFFAENGRIAEAEPLLREVLVWRLRTRNPGYILRARMDLAWCLCQLGHYGEVQDHLAEVQRSPDSPYWGEAAKLRGLIACEAGDLREARSQFAAAIQASERERRDRSLAIVTGYLALLDWWEGDRAAAQSGFRRCIEIHQRTEQPNLASIALLWLASLEGCEGRKIESEATFTRAAHALAQRAAWPLADAITALGRALVAHGQGHPGPVQALLAREDDLVAQSLELRFARKFVRAKTGRR